MKFELRRNTDIVILEAIVHILVSCGEPLLNSRLLHLDETNENYIKSMIEKLLADGESTKAKFFNEDAPVPKVINDIFSTGELINNSGTITEVFNRTMDQYSMPSGNLIVVRLMVQEQPAVAILKLDYQTVIENEIKIGGNDPWINLTFKEIGLPQSNKKLSAGAVIVKGQADYDMVGFEAAKRDLEGEVVEFFFHEFLRAARVIDNIDKTKVLHKQMEKWVRRNVKNQMDMAIGIREDLREIFTHQVEVSIQEIANDLIDDRKKREKFLETLEVAGLDTEEKFELDKVYLEKVQKNKTTKTDTGIVIKGKPETFDDPSKYGVKYNGDGTVDLIIKNVRNISQA